MNEPDWIDYSVVLAIQEAQLAEHGGLLGVRDQGLLESALARLKNLFLYTPGIAMLRLAAAYAVGLAKNHAFVDGNKRTAWVVCATFLELNDILVTADQAEVVRVMLAVADGTVSEQELASWLQQPGVTEPV